MSNNNTLLMLFVIVVLVAGGIFLFMQGDSGGPMGDLEPGEVTDTNSGDNEGTAAFSVTDVAADMENVSEIYLTIDGLSLQSQGEGWVDADINNEEFALLELNASGNWQLLSVADVRAGTYNQIRVMVDSIEVETTDGARTQVQLPSNALVMNSRVDVGDGEVASVNFDFLADQSLHVTGEGDYIFAPVVRVESKSNANVSVDAEGRVQVSGGNVQFNNSLGMNLEGNMMAGFSLDPGVSLMLENGAIKLEVTPGSGADVDVGVGGGAEADGQSTSSDNDGSIEGDVDVEAEGGAGVEVE